MGMVGPRQPGHGAASAVLAFWGRAGRTLRICFPQPQTAIFQEPSFESTGSSCPETPASRDGTTRPSGTDGTAGATRSPPCPCGAGSQHPAAAPARVGSAKVPPLPVLPL